MDNPMSNEQTDVSECKPLLLDLKTKHKKDSKQITRFYKNQVEFLTSYYKDLDQVSELGNDKRAEIFEIEKKQRKRDSLLAKVTLFLNLILLAAKIVAAYLSGSLAVISSVIESAVDITGGATVWLTLRAIENADPFEYPRGRAKLEPLAIVVVSIIMGVASILVIIISVQSIIEKQVNPEVGLSTLIILLTAIASKTILMMFCLRERSANAGLLALDQRNDVVTNTVALVCAYIGDRVWLYADPLGAIAVSTVVSGCWFYVAWQQVPILSGKRASVQHINRIISLCYEHKPSIDYLDKILVYHYTDKLLVDVRIVLPRKMPLEEAVSVSVSLQEKLECLPYVQRAFVSLACYPNEKILGFKPDILLEEPKNILLEE